MGYPSEVAAQTQFTFSVAEGKLWMVGLENMDGDMVPREEACDVLMWPGKAMRLENCVVTNDFGADVISEPAEFNTEYSKVMD